MSRYSLFDRRQLVLRRLAQRGSDMTMERLLRLARPQSSFVHPDFDELARAILTARQANRLVVVMMGGHPIKLGLSWFLIDLMERHLITHVATNGAGIIHDFELAMAGGTSENAAKWIQAGQFGLWRETSRLNALVIRARDTGTGTRGEPVPLSHGPPPRHFTTAVFDLVDLPDNFREGPPGKRHPLYYYRPWKTVLFRTIAAAKRARRRRALAERPQW